MENVELGSMPLGNKDPHAPEAVPAEDVAPERADIAGVILAGGEGRRMGGRDKGQVPLAGRPLVAHVHERLVTQVAEVLVVAARNQVAYQPYGRIVTDLRPDFQGPLAGIEAAAARIAHRYMLVVPCDQPCLPLDLAHQLLAPLDEHGADVANVRLGQAVQPLPCLVKTDLAAGVGALLAQGRRSVKGWQQGLRCVTVDFSGQEEAFRNINNDSDLECLEAQLRGC